jgi:hypothetical protein
MFKKACRDCHYWHQIEISIVHDKTKGKCHRYPPTPLGWKDFYWPVTHYAQWCGEWKEREK